LKLHIASSSKIGHVGAGVTGVACSATRDDAKNAGVVIDISHYNQNPDF
jgi:hypothetical protein